jgi:demethylspheroidene O-methyltransferase
MSAFATEAAAKVASISERWRNLRNRLISSPGFQSWAARSPLTRYIARKRARALYDLCAGFVYSQTLLACVRLRAFERLASGPKTISELADDMRLPAEGARRLMKAGASLGLFHALSGDRFVLDDLGAAMLGNPSIAAFVAHHDLFYDDLRDPVALLRGESKTSLSQFWPYASDRPGQIPEGAKDDPAREQAFADYCDLMSQSQVLVAGDILDAYPVERRHCLLDVGGGEGGFLAAAAARAPDLALRLFELPHVAERARAQFASRGLNSRAEVFSGSFLNDPLPKGADLISFVRVLHDHDDEAARVMLAAAYAALPSGGVVLVAEPMSETPGAEPMGDAYFGFYLLAMGRGRPRSADEIGAFLRTAGFVDVSQLKTRRPLLGSVVIGRRP